MSQVHEIRRLTLNIDGGTKLPANQRLQSLVQGIIEEYFDRYDLQGFDTIFESIELDLGEFEHEDFERELNVRLRYLLDEELKRFSGQNGIDEQVKERFKLNLTELFEEYIKTGINRQSDESLSHVFTKLLSNDPDSITRVLQEKVSWPIIRNRLFGQVDFPAYESYWTKRYGAIYAPVRAINQQIIADFSAAPMTDFGYKGLQGVLKRLTFDFMLGANFSKLPVQAYVSLLRRSSRDFDSYANRIPLSIAAYLSKLDHSTEMKGLDSSLPKISGDSINRLDKESVIDTFLMYGRTPNELDSNKLTEMIQSLSTNKLHALFIKIIPSLSGVDFISRMSRAHQVLTPRQLLFIYAVLAKQLSGESKKTVSVISNLAIIIDKEYNENIFNLPSILYRSYYQNQSNSDFLGDILIVEVARYLSAKRSHSPMEVSEQLESLLGESASPNLVRIRRAAAQAVKTIENNGEASNVQLQPEWSKLSLVLHFLKTGLWLMPESTPQQSLEQLLDSEALGFRAALSELIEAPGVWMRLIHQFSLDVVHSLFKSVFGLDEAFPVLIEAMETAQNKMAPEEVERQLLEAFINVQIRIRSDENWGYLGNYQLEFARILDPLTSISEFDHQLKSDFSLAQQIENWIAVPADLPPVDTRTQTFNNSINQGRELHTLLIEPSISDENWREVFSGMSSAMIIDLIDQMNELVVIHELPSLTLVLRESKFARVLSENDLISLLIYAARGEKPMIEEVLRKAWKNLIEINKEEAAILEKDVLINISQKKWFGIVDSLIDVNSFVQLLERIIYTGTFQKSTSFATWSDFEYQFRQFVERRETEVVRYFDRAHDSKVLDFVLILSHTTISALKIYLDAKFKRSDYLEVVFSLRTQSTINKKNVDCAIITYGLLNPHFNIHLFNQFVNRLLPELKLPISAISTIDRFDYGYAQATIHYLQFNRWIDERAELDGIEEAIFSSLTHQRELFVASISKSSNSRWLISKILESIPNQRWVYVISLIVERNQREIELYIEHYTQKSKIQTKELAISIQRMLKSRSLKLPFELSSRKFKVPKFTTNESTQINKLDGAEFEDPLVHKLELPAKFLRAGISEQYQDDFDVYQLIEEVVSSGRYPVWSEIQSSDEFEKLLIALHSLSPLLSKRIIHNTLKQKHNAINLLFVLGPSGFLKVMASFIDESILVLGEIADRLAEIHRSLGSREPLRQYFIERFIQVSWVFQSSQSISNTSIVMSKVPIDFGMSTSEYVELLALESLNLGKGKGKEQGMISNFFDSRGSNLSSVTDYRLQRNLDLLKHLVIKGEVPWWADHSKTFPQKISDHVHEFSIKLLGMDPNRWVTDLTNSGYSLNVYRELVGRMNYQQFDRIVLALAPNIGGFIVSFNILLTRVASNVSESQWRLFVLEYVLKTKEIAADKFVADGLSHLSKTLSLKGDQIKKDLHQNALIAVNNGESRFRPFVDMLDAEIDYNTEELVLSPERSMAISFEELFRHYLRFGSHAVGNYQSYDTYTEFIQDLRIEFSRDDIHIRDLIKEELKDGIVRSRLVRFESDHFISELVSILFPFAGSAFVTSSITIQRLLVDLAGLANEKVIHDSLFATVFEQALSPNSETLRADDLLNTYLKKATQLFKLHSINKEVSLDIYPLGEVLKASAAQLFFKPGSKLKLRNLDPVGVDEDEAPITLEEWKKGKVDSRDHNVDSNEEIEGLNQDAEPNNDLESNKQNESVADQAEDDEMEDVPDITLDFEVNLSNAGLVIAWPYMLRYFEILEMVKDNQFKSKKAAKRAVQLLQYLATGLTSAPEHELLLNKVLCGVKLATPIPFELDITDQEREVSDQMLKGLLQNWPRLKNASIEALREGFLVRDGRLIETDDVWQLKVEDKTLDILMDDMPWSFGIIKLPWMDKRLMVEWK